MQSNDDKDAANLAGQLVNFICLDSGKSSAADFRFQAYCHFLPRIGERVEYKEQMFEVTRVYHRTVDTPDFDVHPCIFTNVLCRYLGTSEGEDKEVERLLRSLS